MKYINHLNVIVAIIGGLVIAQALTQTIWNSAPEKKYSLEVPATQPRIQVLVAPLAPTKQKTSAAPATDIRPDLTVVVPRSGAPSVPRASDRQSRPWTALPGQPGGGSASFGTPSRMVRVPDAVTIPSEATEDPPPESDVREMSSRRSARGPLPFGGRPALRPGERRAMSLPPPGGSDVEKRRPDPNAPPPPVQSSMPEQRIQ